MRSAHIYAYEHPHKGFQTSSGDNSFMSRKEIMKGLSRVLVRASGRPSTDGGSSKPPSEFEAFRTQYVRSRITRRSELSLRRNVNSGARQSSLPSDGQDRLAPRLSDHAQALAAVQERTSETNRVNGFAKHRARERSHYLKARSSTVGNLAQEDHNGLAHTPSRFQQDDRVAQLVGTGDLATSGNRQDEPTNLLSSLNLKQAERKQQRSEHSALHSAAPSASQLVDEDDTEDFDAGFSSTQVESVYKNQPPPDVHVVNTVEGAHAAVEQLMTLDPGFRVFACDTEVMDIDVSKQSPCCHGHVICFSVYCGTDVHFGGDDARDGINRSMLWVDTYLDGDESQQDVVKGIWEAFRPFFESNVHRKVWHNYSFDRHVLERMGICMKGFDGDTMHMARLWDSSRTGKGGYSLEALSSDKFLMGADSETEIRGKVSMKKLFGRRNIKKDGTEGKLTVLPPVHELQSEDDTKWRWINYSAYDAKSTWDLYTALSKQLAEEPAKLDECVAASYQRSGIEIHTLWDLYRQVWRPFGELLTDMENAGLAVDRDHLAKAEQRAVAEEEEAKARFRNWAASRVQDAKYMNVGSGPQVLQLLFGGRPNNKSGKPGVPLERVFKVPNQIEVEEDGKKPKKNMDIVLHNVWGREFPSPLEPEVFTPSGIPACSTPVLKSLAGKPGRARKALEELGSVRPSTEGLEALRDDFDDVNLAKSTTANYDLGKTEANRELTQLELRSIAEAKGYGKLFKHFKTVEDGLAACAAVDSLVDASAIDTLLSNFIIPLQSDDISKPDAAGVYRVHCSLNINTETGRLSARRPNLQNQPALEKDRYKVRRAFTADRGSGKTLIVADYGQLELRILAHMANCQSMITAFRLGGDFHSRTALGMYDHIQRAVQAGDCLLEWDGGHDGVQPPPVPLLKDMFASERRRAKILNFSIAYGKTAHGLSKDWGVSVKEAEDTVDKWYSDRQEVRDWQVEQRRAAETLGYVCTILGRRRQLPDASSSNKGAKNHALRAAINTPIQGSAADVATAAMLRINSNAQLKEMGWRLLLQVHDEVILEGPHETAEAAQALVVQCMRSPFGEGGGDPLRVELAVDSKYAETWYDAK